MREAAAEVVRISAEYARRAREIPSDYYSWDRPWNLMMHQQTLRGCIGMLRRASLFPLTGRRIADIGCGHGSWLLSLVQLGADPEMLAGIDLDRSRIELARRRLPQADLKLGQASDLPWPDASFDLVTQFTVFTSILDRSLKRAVAAEMLRVLKPGGAILWFDFRWNNPANSNVAGIRAPEIRELFPDCSVELASVLLAPPVCRRVAGWSWLLAEALHTLPYLRSHYAGLVRRRAVPAARSITTR